MERDGQMHLFWMQKNWCKRRVQGLGYTHRDAVLCEELWGEAAEGAQHGPASVDDLDLTVARKCLWVG